MKLKKPMRGARLAAFTLLELLVALVLSALVLTLVLPLFHQAHERTSEPLVPSWESILRSDLSSPVSPTKCGVSVVRLHHQSKDDAFDRLELQTLCRASTAIRGPLEARYVLEPLQADRNLALVRYGHGWHDGVQTRHVLAEHLSGWRVSTSLRDVRSNHPATAPSTMPADSGTALRVELLQGDRRIVTDFWVPVNIEIQ